jgi:hypothetical protein
MDMQAFFTNYASAVTLGHSKTIASFYAPTFMMESPTERRALKNGFTFKMILKAAHKYYRKRGIMQLKITKLLKADLGDLYKIAQVEWQALRADGSEVLRYDVTYVIAMHPLPKIVFFISHNEQERLKARGLA